MSTLRAFLIWLYRKMLRLYPAAYRQLFVEEMEEVFERALQERARRHPYHMPLRSLRLSNGSIGGWSPAH